MNDILFGVLEVVIVALVAAAARYLVPYLREKLAQSRYAWLVDVIAAAVRGTEQLVGSGHGPDKKKAVIAYIAEWLTDHKCKITEEQIDQLIEAAVQAMNAEKGQTDGVVSVQTD